jgi:AcrR family transcriptional regulator
VPTERVLRAFAAVVAEQGYADTSLAAIAARGRISLSTFYEQFANKEEALEAALASIEAQLLTAVVPAARRVEGLDATVRAALEAACELLASEPDLARLWTVEVTAAGAAAVARRDRGDAELWATVAALGGAEAAEADSVAVEATLGAIHALAYEQVRVAGPAELPALAPLLTYVALVPFVGPEQALAAAGGEAARDGEAHSQGGGIRSSSRPASRPK